MQRAAQFQDVTCQKKKDKGLRQKHGSCQTRVLKY